VTLLFTITIINLHFCGFAFGFQHLALLFAYGWTTSRDTTTPGGSRFQEGSRLAKDKLGLAWDRMGLTLDKLGLTWDKVGLIWDRMGLTWDQVKAAVLNRQE